MSKAFTRDDVVAPDLVPPLRVPGRGEVRYLTAEGKAALEQELAAPGTPPRRAAELAALLDASEVPPLPEPGTRRVFFGAWVELEDEEGARRRYRLVGADEADVRTGQLGVESPLARALLGRALGDRLQVELPRGTVEYTLVGVAYRPPAK